MKIVRTHADHSSVWNYLKGTSDQAYLSDHYNGPQNTNGSKKKNFNKHIKRKSIEISACINQAKEYYEAASKASMASKPNLLFYGQIHLCLAMLLHKSSHDEHFDFLRRQTTKQHGIEFKPTLSEISKHLYNPSVLLRLFKLSIGNVGTFPTIYKSLIGESTWCQSYERPLQFGTISAQRLYSLEAIISAIENILPAPQDLTSYDCFSLLCDLPCMYHYLNNNDLIEGVSTGRIVITKYTDKTIWETMLYAAKDEEHRDMILSRISADDPVEIKIKSKIGTGFVVDLVFPNELAHPNFNIFSCFNDPREITRLIIFEHKLFCNNLVPIYLIMFCLSMLVRYYPDIWVKIISSRGTTAEILEYFVQLSHRLFPIYILNEITNNYYIFEG